MVHHSVKFESRYPKDGYVFEISAKSSRDLSRNPDLVTTSHELSSFVANALSYLSDKVEFFNYALLYSDESHSSSNSCVLTFYAKRLPDHLEEFLEALVVYAKIYR